MPLVKTFGPWIVALFVLSLPIWLTENAADLPSDFGADEVVTILAVLIFVSLLVERTLEVFVSALRDPGASLLKGKITRLKEQKTELEGDSGEPPQSTALKEVIEELHKMVDEQINYKSTTMRISLYTALSAGLLASAVGIRTLESLSGDNVFGPLSDTQETAFQLTDVLLTGGLIAGGAEGIHRMANVFNDFMDSTADRAKRESS